MTTAFCPHVNCGHCRAGCDVDGSCSDPAQRHAQTDRQTDTVGSAADTNMHHSVKTCGTARHRQTNRQTDSETDSNTAFRHKFGHSHRQTDRHTAFSSRQQCGDQIKGNMQGVGPHHGASLAPSPKTPPAMQHVTVVSTCLSQHCHTLKSCCDKQM